MSRTYKDNVVRKAVEMFQALGTTEMNSGSSGFNELCDYWTYVVIGRKLRYGNKRKLMARLKVQDRRRARRELEREVLDPFVYTRKGSEAEYDHACRYEGETYGAQWADWDWYTYGIDYPEDDAFDEEVEWLYNLDKSDYEYFHDAPWDDGFTPMIDEEGYAHHSDWAPRHSNAKAQDFSRGTSLGSLLRGRLS